VLLFDEYKLVYSSMHDGYIFKAEVDSFVLRFMSAFCLSACALLRHAESRQTGACCVLRAACCLQRGAFVYPEELIHSLIHSFIHSFIHSSHGSYYTAGPFAISPFACLPAWVSR
jgi:hypothetical protein